MGGGGGVCLKKYHAKKPLPASMLVPRHSAIRARSVSMLYGVMRIMHTHIPKEKKNNRARTNHPRTPSKSNGPPLSKLGRRAVPFDNLLTWIL